MFYFSLTKMESNYLLIFLSMLGIFAFVLAHQAENPLSGEVHQEDHQHGQRQEVHHGAPAVQSDGHGHGDRLGHAAPADQGNIQMNIQPPVGDQPGRRHNERGGGQHGAPGHHGLDSNAVHDAESVAVLFSSIIFIALHLFILYLIIFLYIFVFLANSCFVISLVTK